MAPFHIRHHVSHPEDTEFLVAAFDSCIPYCESIGSGGMWGTQLFSAKDGFVEATKGDVLASERYRTTGEGEAVKIFVAEKLAGDSMEDGGLSYRMEAGFEDNKQPGSNFLKVGAAMVKLNWFPSYIRNQAHLQPLLKEVEEAGSWVYIEVMISDFRTTETARKGVGVALLDHVRGFALEKGAESILVDSWALNHRKLISFYESNGFVAKESFTIERKDKEPWPAVLLRQDLGQ